MRDKWQQPADEVLHLPAVHGDVFYIDTAPDWIVRTADAAEIRGFAASDDDSMHLRQQNYTARRLSSLPKGAIEVRSTPVVLENARFAHGMVSLSGRYLLNGASGLRARTKFEAANPDKAKRDDYLQMMRAFHRQGTSELAVRSAAEANRLDISIELKNGFNYYHFLTETLGALAHYLDDETGCPIVIHLPDRPIKNFVRQFVDAIYPSLAHRVWFDVRPARFEAVRSVYSHQHYLSSVGDASVQELLGAEGMDPLWLSTAMNPRLVKKTGMQSYDTSLRLLRQAALEQVDYAEVGPTPRLIWMGRDEGGKARARGLSGHEPLLQALKARGFEPVIFERLSPLEQIATMNRADIVIAPHGAGLANMVFAKPGARVIELGNRQTQVHRWGDFFKCAHVSGCRYDTVFADIDGLDDLSDTPPIGDGLRGIRLGKRATDCILQIVDETLATMDRPDAGPRRHAVRAA